jgi:hypothetical protein
MGLTPEEREAGKIIAAFALIVTLFWLLGLLLLD